MKEKNLTLAFAESITCGLATQKLSNFKGTSDVLKGSVVCYTPEVKTNLLKISQKNIDRHTCESREVTAQLARNLRSLIKADICAALTGLASPGGTDTKEKPVGSVFLAVLYKNRLHHRQKVYKGSPLLIREKACYELYRFILELTN